MDTPVLECDEEGKERDRKEVQGMMGRGERRGKSTEDSNWDESLYLHCKQRCNLLIVIVLYKCLIYLFFL